MTTETYSLVEFMDITTRLSIFFITIIFMGRMLDSLDKKTVFLLKALEKLMLTFSVIMFCSFALKGDFINAGGIFIFLFIYSTWKNKNFGYIFPNQQNKKAKVINCIVSFILISFHLVAIALIQKGIYSFFNELLGKETPIERLILSMIILVFLAEQTVYSFINSRVENKKEVNNPLKVKTKDCQVVNLNDLEIGSYNQIKYLDINNFKKYLLENSWEKEFELDEQNLAVFFKRSEKEGIGRITLPFNEKEIDLDQKDYIEKIYVQLLRLARYKNRNLEEIITDIKTINDNEED